MQSLHGMPALVLPPIVVMLLAPACVLGEIRLVPEHRANRFAGCEIVSFAQGILKLKAERRALSHFVLWADAPLLSPTSTEAEVSLHPGWDGSLGYSLYALEVNINQAGLVRIKLKEAPPPLKPIPTTKADLAEFKKRLASRPSRFPDAPEAFRQWQVIHRSKLAAWLMGGERPRRVPLEPRVLETLEYPEFRLRRVEYRSQSDRTNVLLIALPRRVHKAPLLLALHGHEAPWGKADAAAFRMGHADDFCAYFANRGWAVVQPATMNHDLQHKNWTLQGEWTWDAMVALDYALSQPAVDSGRIAVCGLSTGGHLAMNVLAMDQRIRAGVVGCILSTWNHYDRRFRFPPHCDCGIRGQLGSRLEQCDWAALAAPKPVQFQHGRKDYLLTPGADESLLDLSFNKGSMPVVEYRTQFSEIERAYGLSAQPHNLTLEIHQGDHRVNNAAAFKWLSHWLAQ